MSRYIRVVKIAVGSTVASLIAYAIGLNYAMSAGIITLLTLQDTKKETLLIALKRIGAFALSVFIAHIVFTVFSYNVLAYGVFLFFYSGACFFLNISSAISMNAVLATHFLAEKNMSLATIGNEAMLLFIGAGIGVLMNLYIPSNVKQIRKMQRLVEDELKAILKNIAEFLLNLGDGGSSVELDTERLDVLKGYIDSGIKQAYMNMNNTFFHETRYYIEYMEMRNQQYKILLAIYDSLSNLKMATLHCNDIASFISTISASFSESQNAKGLLAMGKSLLDEIKKSPMPVTREEFENRAIMYTILMDLRIFLKIKEEFSDSLTEEQKRIYWG